MKKSEVIKLMKEGTHCIYNDCSERNNLLSVIIKKSTNRETGVRGLYSYYWIVNNKGICLGNNKPLGHEVIHLSEIEPDNEKPYLFYEGEKYYFGEEYEFGDGIDLTHISKLFSSDLEDGKMFMNGYSHIRKIDRTSKYKKLLLELKEQAEKDGVNLKELI